MMTDLVRKSSYDGKFAGLYDLEETLGRGHFAIVKLAKHVFTGEKVAVKVIDKTKLDEVSRAHLFQEVRCMKLVQHPHVVRLYEVIDTQSKLYLILELGDGGDMYDYIMQHESGLDEDLARTYFQQIVQAISYCHKMHVVHRDLKPENVIFFKKQGVVKLTDFGFSNLYSPGQKLETSCGSLAYSAPEILLGDSYDAPAVDVWSLGVLLFMLVCGEPPFNETNDSETLTMIMDCKYHMPDHLSDECKSLIARMLVKEPTRRLTLSDIENDPWLSQARENYTYVEPFITRKEIGLQLHDNIVDTMVKGEVADRQKILNSVDGDSYDHVAATYFLLAERRLKKQYEGEEEVEKTPQNKHSGTLSKPQHIPSSSRVPAESSTSKVSSTVPASKPVAIPVMQTSSSSKCESRSPEDAVMTGSPRRHFMEREHLTLHPKHGRSLVREGLQSVEETEFQHVAEEEPELFDEAFELDGPSEQNSQENGRGWRRQTPRASNATRLSTSVLNQITEEEDEGEESEDDMKVNKFPIHRTIRHRKTIATDNIHLIKTSTKTTAKASRPLGGYSSSDASDDDTDPKRRSDRFDLPSKGQRRGSKDGPPGSGGNSGANNGGGSLGGGGMNNGSAGGGGGGSGSKDTGNGSGGPNGAGYERKKSNELRESLKMSNLSMTSSRSSSSYSISKYAIDPNNTTPSDSDEQGGDTKNWSDEKKDNLQQDGNATVLILTKDPSDVNIDSPSKRKHYSSTLKETNSDLNSNVPRLSRKEQKEIRKKRNRLSNHHHHQDDHELSSSRERRVESNCCRLI